MPQLTLYHYEGCPYSERVCEFIRENKVTVLLKDIRQSPQAREELIKIGGKTQVPCLAIDGVPLYESRDIIKWLRENGKK